MICVDRSYSIITVEQSGITQWKWYQHISKLIHLTPNTYLLVCFFFSMIDYVIFAFCYCKFCGQKNEMLNNKCSSVSSDDETFLKSFRLSFEFCFFCQDSIAIDSLFACLLLWQLQASWTELWVDFSCVKHWELHFCIHFRKKMMRISFVNLSQ